MLNNQVFYWGIIRKTIIAFGRLFSDIYIDRKVNNSVSGTTVQRLQIPITYAPREKWLVRLEQDPNLAQNVAVSLPRMSFEITGYSYDPSRKVSKMNKIVCNTSSSSTSMFAPVPYNIDIALYILTKTQEDGLQIIEQILPTFNPEYTLAINAVPSMNIVQDVPITLNGITVSDDYEGDFETRRLVTHTLTFTLKVNLFGPASSGKPIYDTITSVSIDQPYTPIVAQHTAEGNPTTYVITTDQWDEDL